LLFRFTSFYIIFHYFSLFVIISLSLPLPHSPTPSFPHPYRLITFWRQYYSGAGIILFIIDSSDTQRVTNAKDELYRLIYEDELIGIPLLVIANKQDMPGALTPDEIATELELNYLAPRLVHIIGTCAKTKQGFTEVQEWIQKHAVLVHNLPEHLVEYNRRLETLTQSQRDQHNRFVSRRASAASVLQDEQSLLSNTSEHNNHNNGNNNNKDDKNDKNDDKKTNSTRHDDDSTLRNSLNSLGALTSTRSELEGKIHTHSDIKADSGEKNHQTHLNTTEHPSDFRQAQNDPTSVSISTNSSNAALYSTRRPRLTVSIEQQVAQALLHQQIINAASHFHANPTTPTSGDSNTTLFNKDGIPISLRHVEEFTQLSGDLVMETTIVMRDDPSSTKKGNSSIGNGIQPVIVVKDDKKNVKNNSDLKKSDKENTENTENKEKNNKDENKDENVPIDVKIIPQTASNTNIHTDDDNNRQSQPDRRTSVTQRDSFNNITTRRTSITQPSPSSSRQRRRSSVGVTQLSTDEMEGISRARKISLSLNQQDDEVNDEFLANNESVLIGHEDILQEPNLDTVNELQEE
jgi:GTPase SAR1 family protein